MLYQITPLAVLIAVLVTFGVLNRNSEIIAMKATRHQPLPAGDSHRFHRRHSGSQPLSLRPVLSAPGQPQAGGSAQYHQRPPAANRACTPNKTGSSASRIRASQTAFSTTSFSTRNATSSPISRSSNSILPPLDSRGASLPRALSGMPRRARGGFRTDGSATSQGANVQEYRRFQQTAFTEIHEDPATSRRKACKRRR